MTILVFSIMILFSMVTPMRSFTRVSSLRGRSLRAFSASPITQVDDKPISTGDCVVSGLNGAQDIIVRAVCCRELVQESMLRNNLSPQTSDTLAHVMAASMMMGSGLKNNETLQVNIVGSNPDGIRNVMVITDGELKVRGLVGNPVYSGSTAVRDSFGTDGQIQCVRNHPDWKAPQVGMTLLRDMDISLNLAFYMVESEQRSAFILTDVRVDGNLCRHALGLMVERLPGVSDENIDLSIRNLEAIEKKGLRSYLDRTEEQRKSDNSPGGFRSFEAALETLIDDVMVDMDEGMSIRWTKEPSFKCGCSAEKVMRTLRLLPTAEVEVILEENTGDTVEVKCEFCGQVYHTDKEQIRNEILSEDE